MDELISCAGAVVRDPDGRILLIVRGHEPDAGRWSLPGGRVEPGESLAEAALREVREETGLDIELGRLIGVVVRGRYEIHDFAATAWGEPTPGDDATDARWLRIDDLVDLDLTPGLLDFLREHGVIPE